MFHMSKLDVDRHVEECLKKINNETERNLRCFSFAKQYFKIERYEDARRYVTAYLSVKPNSAEAHYLLGRTLEMLGKKEAAFQAYSTSLRLDPKQNNLVIKVCELLASDDIELDRSGAKYFCEMAQSFDPHNPAIFSLKQRIITSGNEDPVEISNLLLKELENRPADVRLRIRLIKHLLQSSMVKEAYKHVSDIEAKDLPIFHNNLSWYETVAEVLVKYQRTVPLATSLGWEFWFLSVSVLDKLVALNLDEHCDNPKTSSEFVGAVFNFDQTLLKASQNIADCPDKQLVQQFLNHYRAQLCFHFTTLMFKQANKDRIKYKEASNLMLPLLFAAYQTPPPDLQSMWFIHVAESRRNLVRRWRREATFRCSQTGHVLTAAAKDRKSTIIEKAEQYSMGLWREQLFKKLFTTRDHQNKMATSYFLTDQQLIEIVIRLPEKDELLRYDEEAQWLYPDSLHHHIWIALNNKLSDQKCTVFEGLQYSIKHLKNCGAETLNILDIQAFIDAATLCAQCDLDSIKNIVYYNTDKPNVVPAAVTKELGTLNQSKFFKAAYKMFKNEYESGMDQLRCTIIEGIKILRCVDHGLDVQLLIILANTFAERAKKLTKQAEIEQNDARAEMYWRAALPLLEKMKNNQAVAYPPNKLFNFTAKDLTLSEICANIETGKLFSGTQLMKKKEYEKALRVFEVLKDPYASFYQAQIYKHMADQQIGQSKENVTSEMRSQNIILLSRARDCLYLTLDRLREPSVDQKHPLNSQLGTEIEKIECLLSRIDPDCTNRNECDGMSDENVSSADSVGDHYVTGYSGNNASYFNGTFTPGLNNRPHFSTPYRLDVSRREAKPSPERLDAQLRQLTASKDASIVQILEHNKVMVDSHRSLVDELRSFKEAVTNLTSTVEELKGMKQGYEELKDIKKSVNDLKTSIDELDNFRNVTDIVYEMKKEIAELKKDLNKAGQLSEEDIYGLANDYGADYNINSNLAAYNSNLYPNYQGRMPNATSLYGPPPPMYPLYPAMAYAYGGLGLQQMPGNMPLPPDQQLASDFRSISAALSQPPYGPAGLQTPLNQTPLSSAALGVGLLTGQGLSQAPMHSLFKDQKAPPSSAPTGFSTITSIASLPISKAPPVNVVITTSDPLPSTKTSTAQPILSVTIPPQHLKGNVFPKTAHNYQIPLPTSGIANTSPSVLSKPPPAVSTQSLLLNVAPPVYSAIDNKTPMNVSLGLQIEKSLDQINSSKNDSFNKSNLSNASVDEHDPCPDFKPIIPLPDEVPVTTGEENETVLFTERAKLFRHVTTNGNNEWKERGVGILKILKNNDTQKVRILMRRDQVHKICANHFLTKDMTLTPKSDRAYMWAAHDFADEEVVVEKLCARFKTAEEAKKFYEAFKNAKRNLTTSTTVTPVTTPLMKSNKVKSFVTPVTTPVTTSIEAFKDKPLSSVSLGGFTFSTTPTFKTKPEPTAAVLAQQTTPKSSPFSTFTFGAAQSSPFPNLQSEFKTDKNDFSLFKQQPAIGQPPKPSGDDDAPADDFVPTAEFKPVVPLPELVEVKTGEENAEVLFEDRAKLLRFDTSGDTKEWKERGVGVMKLLKENTVRLVMRRDQVHKVCCNHQLLKSMEFKLMTNNPKAVTWCAKDFSEGVIKPETFAIKFKTEEITNDFLKAVTAAQASLDDNSCVTGAHVDKHFKGEQKSPGFGDKFKPVKGSWGCKNCYVVNDGKANYCLACETPKNDSMPKKNNDRSSGAAFSFGVSSPDDSAKSSWGTAFKPKEGSWECQACYTRNDADKNSCVSCNGPKDATVVKKAEEKGVNLDTGGLKFSFGIPATVTSVEDKTVESKPVASGWGEAFKPKEGSWECKSCYTRNNSDALYCLSCENPKDETVPKKDAKQGVNLDTPGQKFTFGLPATSQTDSGAKATFTFGQTSIPTFSQFSFNTPKTETGSTPIFTSPFSFTPTSTTTGDKKNASAEKFVFGSPQKHDFEFTPRSPRRISTGQKDEESDCSYVEEEGDNIYFKPVIPLPDKVEVKTGEEGENVLYCSRAKLFRFASGEWKERGLGDIKILQRKDNGKLRVLMRREQVFKICLNHVLTADIKYLAKDDKTWLFSAADFSEGVLANEQFCVRFKTPDIAQEFKKAVDDALSNTSDVAGDSQGQSGEDSDVEFIGETTVTPEEEKEALKLGLPPKYMSYRRLPDCTCDQCKRDDEYFKTTTDKPDVSKSNKTSVAASASPAAPLFGAAPKQFVFTSTTTEAPANTTDTLKTLLSKPSLLAAPKTNSTTSFGSPIVFSTPELSKSSVFGTPVSGNSSTTGLFGSKATSYVTPSNSAINTFSFSAASSENNSSVGTTSSLLGTPNVASSKPTSTGVFSTGISANAFGGVSSNGSIFGTPQSSSVFGAGNKSIFGGVSSTVTTSSPFPTFTASTQQQMSLPKVAATATASIFGNVTSTTPSSLFGGNAFGASIDQSKLTFGSIKTKDSTPLFGASNQAISSDKTGTDLKEDDAPVLDCNTGLSFASLAANVSSPTPVFQSGGDASSPFAFLGAGAPVFGSHANDSKSKSDKNKSGVGDDGDDGATADDEYDPHYDPIVPLPDAIVVSTGEEDETLVFNERAKLYRFDATNKEWKERGVGQMKILHHPINRTYRFLLRREQVHKVVLNQLIIPDLDIQPMSSSDKAWMWAGYNYTEDESALEQLAVRFKNCDLAQQFYKVVQEVILKVKNVQSEKLSTSADLSVNTVSSPIEVTPDIDGPQSSFIPSTILNYGVEDISNDEGSSKHNYEEEDDDEDDEDDEDEDDR